MLRCASFRREIGLLVCLISFSMLGKARANEFSEGTQAVFTYLNAGQPRENAYPHLVEGGPFGKFSISGLVTGLVLFQDAHLPGDPASVGDLTNAQIFIHKTTGVLQYSVQAGEYSIPVLGSPYLRAARTTTNLYGNLPEVSLKIVPKENFSLQIGKLPSLMGAEATFTYENPNIERGLLYTQTPGISKGIQANFNHDGLRASVSLNDTFSSNRYSGLSVRASQRLSGADQLTVAGATNLRQTDILTPVTPLYLNNEQIVNLIYSHTLGGWTLSPYVQYTNIPTNASIAATKPVETIGGAFLALYKFGPKANLLGISMANLTLPARVEFMSTSGTSSDGSPNVLFGAGSRAYSLSLTPTLQFRACFLRAELSYVRASNITPGSGFGRFGDQDHQFRGMVEAGIAF